MTPAEVVAEVVRWSGLRTTEASDPALVLAAEAVVAYVEGLPILSDRADGSAGSRFTVTLPVDPLLADGVDEGRPSTEPDLSDVVPEPIDDAVDQEPPVEAQQ